MAEGGEFTLALIKPDVCGKPRIEVKEVTDEEGNTKQETTQLSLDMADEIIEKIENAGFTVVEQTKVVLTKEKANAFYAEHRGKPFFNALTTFMSSGTTCALKLQRDDAIKGWRGLVETKETGIRAIFGTDATMNAVHGSDSPYSAMRELEFFFPSTKKLGRALALMKTSSATDNGAADAFHSAGFLVVGSAEKDGTTALCVESMNAEVQLSLAVGARGALAQFDAKVGSSKEMKEYFPDPFAVEQTLALIKPRTADDVGAAGAIMAAIEANGFTVLNSKRLQLTKERAELFYAEHRGKGFFQNLTSYMSSGPLVALVLAKPSAIKGWRQLLGPTNSFTAKAEAPESIRGMFGIDGTMNACHGSDSPASAAREIRFYFPSARPPALPAAGPTAASHPELHQVVLKGLAALCKEEDPGTSIAAARWLGQWLLDHKPGGPSVADAEDDWTPAPPQPPSALSAKIAAMPNGGAMVAEPAHDPPIIVFVLGGPGSGKGTQCAKIVRDFGFTHLSAGDLLRAEVASGSKFGKKLEADMASGALVPPKVVLHLLKKAMGRGVPKSRFLIDGFPRTREQAFMFEKEVGRCNLVLNFDCSEEVMLARLLQRGKTSGRVDDNEEAIRKRFKVFTDESKPVVDFYSKLGLVATVDATLGSPDAVYKKVVPSVRPTVVCAVGGPASGLTAACAAAAAQFGFAHASVDGVVAEVLAAGGEDAAELQALIDTGYDLPTETVLGLVGRVLTRTRSMKVLLEGFPRTKAEALAYEERFGTPAMVLNLQADDSGEPAYARRSKPVLDLLAGSGVLHTVDATAPAGTVAAQIARKFSPEVVFVVGGDGVDEGAVCAEIAAKYDGYTHLNVEHMLRAEVVRGTSAGAMIDTMIRNKQAVPVDLTMALLRQGMQGCSTARQGFVVNGFPRTLEHAAAFEAQPGVSCTKLLYVAGAGGGKMAAGKEAVVDYYALAGKVQPVTGDATAAQAACDSLRYDVSLAWGGPGTPASSFAAGVAAEYGLEHLSYDDIAASAMARGTAEGAAMQRLVQAGKLVSTKAKLALVKAAMAASKARRFLLQGFPATADEALALQEVAPVRCVLSVTATDAQLARACVAAGNAAVGRPAEPQGEEDPEAFAAKIDAQVERVLKAMAEKPWDAPAEAAAEPGQNWAKSLATKPGYLPKPGEIPPTMEEEIARSLSAAAEATAGLRAHFTSAGNQTTNGIHDLPVDADGVGTGGAAAKAARLLRANVVAAVGGAGSGQRAAVTRLCREQGYRCLCVPDLHDAAVAEGAAEAADITRARTLGRTVPAAVSAALVKQAVLAASVGEAAGRSFVLDGFPRCTGAGAPYAHDQVFAVGADAALGGIDAVVAFDAPAAKRAARAKEGEGMGAAAFEDAEDAYAKQAAPLVVFAESIGKLTTVSTAGTPEAAYDSLKAATDGLPALHCWGAAE